MFEIKYKIAVNRVGDLLCNAWEGGSTYWAMVEKSHTPEKITFGTMGINLPYSHEIALNEGGWVQLRDIEDDKIIKEKLTLRSIKKGLKIFASDYPKHFSDFISENDDATTGDIFLQCCVFGKAIYG